MINAEGHAAFATDKGVKGLMLLVEQYRQDGASAQPSDVGASFEGEMFGQEKAAMVISGNWAIPYLEATFPKLEFGAAEIPRINDQPGTMVYTVAYVMNQQAEHKAEAWELIAYLTGKEGMKNWTSTGFALPTRKSIATALGYDQDPLRAPLVAGVNYATPCRVANICLSSSIASTISFSAPYWGNSRSSRRCSRPRRAPIGRLKQMNEFD